jgi:dipeptidyl aminopeptidase/acylaminoacyl peptidase
LTSFWRDGFCLLTILVSQAAYCQQSIGSQQDEFARENRERPFSVEDSIRLTTFGDPKYEDGTNPGDQVAHFSPDGRLFAIVLKRSNIEQDTNQYSLLLYHTEGAFNHPPSDVILSLSSSSNRPAIEQLSWLDNETLAFLGERPGEEHQLYTFNCMERQLRQLTHHKTSVLSYSISASHDLWVFTAEEGVSDLAGPGAAHSYISPGAYYSLIDLIKNNDSEKRRYEGKRLFKQDGINGPEEPISIQDGIRGSSDLWLSPDGKRLIVQGWVQSVPARWNAYVDVRLRALVAASIGMRRQFLTGVARFTIVNITTGASELLLNSPMAEPWRPEVAWSPDSRSVVLNKVYLPLDSDKEDADKKRLSTAYAIEVQADSKSVTPIIDKPVRLVRWDRKTGRVLFVDGDEQHSKLIAFEKNQASWQPVKTTPSQGTILPKVRLEESFHKRPQIVVSDQADLRREVLIDLNPELEDVILGRVEDIRFPSPLHHDVKAGLYYPTHFQKGIKYPLVIQTHGWRTDRFWTDGPWTSTFAAQSFANRGFMVLQIEDDPDIGVLGARRMSTPEEAPLQMGVYEAAIDYLDRAGLIDPSRLGIVGFSRTGLAVRYTLIHSKYHFSAATIADAADAGYFLYVAAWNAYPDSLYTDIQSLNGTSPFGEGLYQWIKNDSDFQLDRVKTPVRLEAYGPATLLFNWEWFSGLSHLNKPVDLIYIPDGTHELKKPSHRLISQGGNVDWMSFWIENYEDSDPAKVQQYKRWRELRTLQEANNTEAPVSGIPNGMSN